MTKAPGLDLDAARRESAFPDGIPITFGQKTFTLPVELPLDVIDTLVSDEFGLINLIKSLVANGEKNIGKAVVDTFLSGVNIPKQVLDSVYELLAVLFGRDQWEEFRAQRPSLPDLGRLGGYLIEHYGVSLGEAFASLTSSVPGGATSKPTSPATTGSTPEPSGGPKDSEPGSSESDG